MIWLLPALALLEHRVTRRNLGAEWNGYGAVTCVLRRIGKAPMRYRVLVPWLIRWVPPRHRLAGYLIAKWLLMGTALLAATQLVGSRGALALAVLIAATFEFDYWDCYAELTAVCLCLYGDPMWALVGVVLWSLSKETVLLAPLLVLVSCGPLMAVVAGLLTASLWLAVRRYQGAASLYSGRWSIRKQRLAAWRKNRLGLSWFVQAFETVAIAVVGPYNPTDLKNAWSKRDVGVAMSLLWAFGSVTAAVLSIVDKPSPLASSAWIGLIWIGAGWILARARETRIFMPAALWMVAYA